ncbi:hypothetical protein I4P58_14235 [Enterobacter roggenkampii]|uniref:DUF6602 domain-containing protein n=1 Tax=Enterobacter roggenkampii TaxID=1812935 RepID=UPI0018C3397C|nr:DUF6602 domain-containing protein [Enterobacter roggenkampii]MBF9818176.1 hypothetical protein [Enterobacter roggenkampii]
MSILSEKILSRIKMLKREFYVNKNIVHQGIKGGMNEVELMSIVKDVIPRRYEISRGVIENACGEQSNETDSIIYDNEILPPYINNDLVFVPVEAVKYNFEIKTTLTLKELETTISKFRRFQSMGGKSPTVLFSFSSNAKQSELARYYGKDCNFLTNPEISVFCVSNKCYYYKHTEIKYLKDYLSNSDVLESFYKQSEFTTDEVLSSLQEILRNDVILSNLTRSQFALLLQSAINAKNSFSDMDSKNLTINGISFSEITFKIHKWIGVECSNDDVELSFFSGISNTLSKEKFGNYLLNERVLDVKVFSVCYEDMWGNISCQKFDWDGVIDNIDEVGFSFQSNSEESKIIFSFKDA